MRALFYLTIRRFANSLKRLPKNPRLLVPVIFFALILLSQILPLILLQHERSERSPYQSAVSLAHRRRGVATAAAHGRAGLNPALLVASIKGLLLVSLLTAVISALGDGSLFFEPSDVDFLFPAPLSRRAVLLFRMLPRYAFLVLASVYFPIILSSTLVEATPDLNLPSLWPGVLGTYLFLVSGANLAQAGVIFRWEKDSGASTPERRQRVAKLSFGLFLVLAVVGYLAMRQAAADGARGGFSLGGALALLNGQAVSIAIAPVSWAAELYRVAYEGWNAAAGGRLAGLLTLAGLSFLVLFRRESDFYEGATEVSARRGRLVAAARRGDSSALLSQMAEDGSLRVGAARGLRSFGGGAWAVLWRDFIAISRMPLRTWMPLLLIALFPALFGQIVGRRSDIGALAWMVMFCLQMSGIFLVAARTMLRRADITKALPIGPVRFLLAEQATSIAQLTVLGWLSLTIMVLFGGGRGPFLIAAYLVFPTLTTLIIFVQTSFVLLYPQQNDIAQNFVGNILGLLVSALALVPSIGVGLLMHFFLDSPPYLIGLAAGAANIASATAAVLFAAFLWERFDPTG